MASRDDRDLRLTSGERWMELVERRRTPQTRRRRDISIQARNAYGATVATPRVMRALRGFECTARAPLTPCRKTRPHQHPRHGLEGHFKARVRRAHHPGRHRHPASIVSPVAGAMDVGEWPGRSVARHTGAPEARMLRTGLPGGQRQHAIFREPNVNSSCFCGTSRYGRMTVRSCWWRTAIGQ